MDNAYDFEPCDTAVALILTRYLIYQKTVKAELRKVIDEDGGIHPEPLTDLLDRAYGWYKGELKGKTAEAALLTDLFPDEIEEHVRNFSGREYVATLREGFARYLDDLLHDRIHK